MRTRPPSASHRSRPWSATVVLATALALAVTGATPAVASDVRVFQSFESDADLAGASVSLPASDRLGVVKEPTQGSSSLRLRAAPGSTAGATGSATLTLRAGTASLPSSDWSGHAAVGWDFFTDADRSATVGGVTVTDTAGASWAATYPIRARSWTPFNARLSDLRAAGVDVSSIASVAITMPRGDQPVNGYLDAMRFSGSYPYDQSAFGARAADALLHLGRHRQVLGSLSHRLADLDLRLGHRPNAADRRLRAKLVARQQKVADLQSTLRDGPRGQSAYQAFNNAVGAEEQAVPRLANLIEARRQNPTGDFGVDSADSMSLVYPKDVAFASTGRAPAVGMARGEYENTQAVVLPWDEQLRDVAVTVRSIRGPGAGRGMSAGVSPVGSLDTAPTDPSNRPLYSGWTPDPIRTDLRTADVAADDVQAYWVQLHADRTAAPGAYRVQLEVSARGKRPQTMTVTATVWPFAIDNDPKLATSFQYTPDITAALYGVTDPAAKERLTHQYWDFLDQFKIKPDQTYTVDGDPGVVDGFTVRPTPVKDVLYIKKHYGLRHFNALYLYAGFINPDKPATWQKQIDAWLGQLRTAMASYKAAGVDKYAYIYGFDEAKGPILKAAKMAFAQVKREFPDLPIMTTLRDNSMGIDSGLADVVDIWAPQQDLYDQQTAERTRARGDQAWWYPDINTGYPLPNWFNGYPPIDSRMLMGPMSHQAGVEGVLNYASNHWTPALRKDHPLLDDGIFSTWNPVTYGSTPGDGSLFYPGAKGPLPSIRLQNFRDGMEDYNLMEELKQRLADNPKAPASLRHRATAVLSARSVVDGKQHFTEDPRRYRAWRAEAAALVSELSTT